MVHSVAKAQHLEWRTGWGSSQSAPSQRQEAGAPVSMVLLGKEKMEEGTTQLRRLQKQGADFRTPHPPGIGCGLPQGLGAPPWQLPLAEGMHTKKEGAGSL